MKNHHTVFLVTGIVGVLAGFAYLATSSNPLLSNSTADSIFSNLYVAL